MQQKINLNSKPGYCRVCGREIEDRGSNKRDKLCARHWRQLKTHGKFLDSLSRRRQDPNEIIIDGDEAYILLYDASGNEIARAIIDANKVGIVKPYKWVHTKIQGAVFRKRLRKGTKTLSLSHVVAGVEKVAGTRVVVRYKNGNKLDCRMTNLEVV